MVRSSTPAPIAVMWNRERRRPDAFVWKGRRYPVDRVVKVWIIQTGWWRRDGGTNRSYWQVSCEGRIYDLSFDRFRKKWRLERVLN